MSHRELSTVKLEYMGIGKDDLLLELLSVDSSDRGKIIAGTIKGVEYARQNKFKDAIKEVKKVCNFKDDFMRQKTAIKIIHTMLADYDKYVNGNLFDFYTQLMESSLIKMPKMKTSGVTKVKTFYDDTTYKEFVLWVKYSDDGSLNRTIHKAKGDEFESVLLILKDKKNEAFDEATVLNFLLKPDLSKEEHRVYYVALSRARQDLFINVPELSKAGIEHIERIGFDVINLR